MQRILEGNGFAVIGAANAAEALEIFHHTPVTLVVSDHLLGGKTGAELAEEIKAIKPSVPIVLRSGCAPESLANIDAFILKGEPVKDFLQMISSLVQRAAS